MEKTFADITKNAISFAIHEYFWPLSHVTRKIQDLFKHIFSIISLMLIGQGASIGNTQSTSKHVLKATHLKPLTALSVLRGSSMVENHEDFIEKVLKFNNVDDFLAFFKDWENVVVRIKDVLIVKHSQTGRIYFDFYWMSKDHGLFIDENQLLDLFDERTLQELKWIEKTSPRILVLYEDD